jgi:hypothetical protein
MGSSSRGVGSTRVRRSAVGGFDTDLIGLPWRQGSMPTPELISLIVALVAWIVLLGTFSADS